MVFRRGRGGRYTLEPEPEKEEKAPVVTEGSEECEKCGARVPKGQQFCPLCQDQGGVD